MIYKLSHAKGLTVYFFGAAYFLLSLSCSKDSKLEGNSQSLVNTDSDASPVQEYKSDPTETEDSDNSVAQPVSIAGAALHCKIYEDELSTDISMRSYQCGIRDSQGASIAHDDKVDYKFSAIDPAGDEREISLLQTMPSPDFPWLLEPLTYVVGDEIHVKSSMGQSIKPFPVPPSAILPLSGPPTTTISPTNTPTYNPQSLPAYCGSMPFIPGPTNKGGTFEFQINEEISNVRIVIPKICNMTTLVDELVMSFELEHSSGITRNKSVKITSSTLNKLENVVLFEGSLAKGDLTITAEVKRIRNKKEEEEEKERRYAHYVNITTPAFQKLER